MSWLAPWFLLGLAAIALPLWLHRLQTRNPVRVPFSSSMLLTESERRLRVQKRLRFLLLLALRIALLTLLALAFAQPLWRAAASLLSGSDAKLHLILVDTSLSMSATNRMAAAQARADDIIGSLRNIDRAQVISAGASISLQAAREGPTNDAAALRRALRDLTSGQGRLQYALAVGSIDSLAGESRLPVVAHLISDFQRSGLATRFADLVPRSESARDIELQLQPLPEVAAPNWRVESVKQNRGNIDVLVRGISTPAARLTVSLMVNDRDRGTQQQPVAASGQVLVRFAGVALNDGDNQVVARLASNDVLAGDDTYYALLQGGGSRAVPLITADTRGASVTYLSAALAAAGARFAVAPVRADQFDARSLARYSWVAIDDAGLLDGALVTALDEFVGRGGSVLMAASGRASGQAQLPLTGQRVAGVTIRNADPLVVGRVDGAHALLEDSSGWQNLAIARMVRIEPGDNDRVLINTDDGAPLLLEQRRGAGRVLLYTSSLDNLWNDLPVQPVFVSFLARAADWLSGQESISAQQTVGGTLQLAQAGAVAGQVIGPDGVNLLTLAATRTAQSVRLQQAGFYQVVTPARTALVAANIDARESELEPLDAATIETWRSAAAAARTVASSPVAAQADEGGTPLAPTLLALLALLVVAESMVGNMVLRRNIKVLT